MTVGGFRDGACGGKGFVEACSTDAAEGAQLREGIWTIGVAKRIGDPLVETGMAEVRVRRLARLGDLEGQRLLALGEFECDTGHGRCGAVLGSQHKTAVLIAARGWSRARRGIPMNRPRPGRRGYWLHLFGRDGQR